MAVGGSLWVGGMGVGTHWDVFYVNEARDNGVTSHDIARGNNPNAGWG